MLFSYVRKTNKQEKGNPPPKTNNSNTRIQIAKEEDFFFLTFQNNQGHVYFETSVIASFKQLERQCLIKTLKLTYKSFSLWQCI